MGRLYDLNGCIKLLGAVFFRAIKDEQSADAYLRRDASVFLDSPNTNRLLSEMGINAREFNRIRACVHQEWKEKRAATDDQTTP